MYHGDVVVELQYIVKEPKSATCVEVAVTDVGPSNIVPLVPVPPLLNPIAPESITSDEEGVNTGLMVTI
jgi:hypothetical protein